MTCEIREICGDWALDYDGGYGLLTLYFNSRQNALTVKRILEVDTSVPNAATVCDMVEVVRCKDCVHYAERKPNSKGFLRCPASGMDVTEQDFCSLGERRNENDRLQRGV